MNGQSKNALNVQGIPSGSGLIKPRLFFFVVSFCCCKAEKWGEPLCGNIQKRIQNTKRKTSKTVQTCQPTIKRSTLSQALTVAGKGTLGWFGAFAQPSDEKTLAASKNRCTIITKPCHGIS
jgi:hypothetical protein